MRLDFMWKNLDQGLVLPAAKDSPRLYVVVARLGNLTRPNSGMPFDLNHHVLSPRPTVVNV